MRRGGRGRGKRPNGRGTRKNGQKTRAAVHQIIPRGVPGSNNVGGANETIQTCSFFKNNLQLTGAGTQAARFLPNGLFDVDPILGSTAAVGAVEWMALYNKYRVLSYEVTYECVNQDTLVAEMNIVNTNLDPGATNTNYPSYARMQYGRHFMLGSVNSMNRKVVKQRITVEQIVGSLAALDSLSAVFTQNPVNVIFTGISANPTTVGALTIGVSVVVTVKMRVLFYERKLLTQ